MSGDPNVARHMAYYAELRAAMSILATIGVGVFNKKHFALTNNLQCELFSGNPGTHIFAWEALENWAQQQAATDLVLDVVRPGGKRLSDWLTHFPHTAGAASQAVLAKQWLLQWGLDLQRLAKDRSARNESSYRPTNITKRRFPTTKQSLRFVETFWQATEPSALNPFKELDRHLLKRSLALAFKNNHPHHLRPEDDPVEFQRLIDPVLHGILPTPGDISNRQWATFLKRSTRDLDVLVHAAKTDDIESSMHHIQVISRATILLRIATGATRKALESVPAGDRGHLAFWWKPIGEARGMWEPGATPPALIDLWSDVEDAVRRLDTWRRAGGKSKKALFTTAADIAHSLASCERVALWSLGAWTA